MTRVLTLQDVFAQLNTDSQTEVGLSATEVVNQLLAAAETGQCSDHNVGPTCALLTNYPINVIQDVAPAAYWRLDDPAASATAFDSMPFRARNPATVNGTVTFQQTGAMSNNHAALLNGTTGYLSAANASGLQLNHDVSLECWIKLSSLSNPACLVSKGTTGEYELTVQTNGSIVLAYGNAGSANNLISSGDSGFEASVSGWTSAGDSCTLSQSSTHAHTGTSSMQMTATAATTLFADTVATYVVSPTVSYLASFWCYTTNTSRTASVKITWYTAAGAVISSSSSTPASLTQNAFTQLTLTASAPALAAAARVYVQPVASTSSESFWVDDVFLGPPTSSNTSTTIAAASSITTGAWFHVVATRSSLTQTIAGYVNGIQKVSTSYSGDPATSTNAVTIGRSQAGTNFLNGLIDEVAIYAKALTSTQVANHYTWGTAANVTATPYGVGKYGYNQYPAASAPGTTVYGGAVWGTFSWG